MKWALAVITMGALLVVSGCITLSLHQLYTDEDLIFEPQLIGLWATEEDSPEQFEFRRGDGPGYHLIHTDENGRKASFDVHLLRANDHLFMDLKPQEIKEAGNELYLMHFFPMHSIIHVVQIEPTLILAPVDTEWLKGFLKDNPGQLKYEIYREFGTDIIILTAGPKELQGFFGHHATTEGAFLTDSPGMKKLK